jgi:hypothetical protein
MIKILVDWIRYTKFFRKAYIREQCIEYMDDKASKIAYNLIKIHMYHRSDMVKSWVSEMNESLLSVQKYIHDHCSCLGYRRNRGYRSFNRFDGNIDLADLKQWLWKHYLETPQEISRRIIDISRSGETAKLSIDELDYADMFQSIKKIMTRVCEDIRDNEFRDIRCYLARVNEGVDK